MGLHRDGTFLDLPPIETERRRRIWWQLQHLDLCIGAVSGAISINITADWDARLPLNIEDEDISPSMRDFPPERPSLTTMSYCLWRYWVLYEQRTFKRPDGSRYGVAWSSNRTLSYSGKEALLEKLENGLNERFLRYCDPIKPIDMVTLISVRGLLSAFRRVMCQPMAIDKQGQDTTKEYRSKLCTYCMQCLEYNVATQTTQLIKQFRWQTKHHFQWSACKYWP